MTDDTRALSTHDLETITAALRPLRLCAWNPDWNGYCGRPAALGVWASCEDDLDEVFIAEKLRQDQAGKGRPVFAILPFTVSPRSSAVSASDAMSF